jgi:beta-xylosidase
MIKTVVVFTISLLTVIQTGNAQSPSFKTYTNPVIPGDHPDCTITKIGNDFYTTGSSFNPTPVIYHSTDLVHWEAIVQPVKASWSGYGDKPGGGCWGGDMVFYNNKFWDFFSRANTMYFVTSDKPEGPWSMPAKVNNPAQLSYGLGYDNSVFIDDNGKWYLVVKNGQSNNGIVELGTDGQPTGVVYDLNWLNPAPSHPYSWAEGPVMWKYNGYYYYSFARNVGGGQYVMRSSTITDDQSAWSTPVYFFNLNDPEKPQALFGNPNHNSASISLNDGSSWVVHPVYYAKGGDWYAQGRQGLLNQVRYDSNGNPFADYPINGSFTAPALPSSGIPWMVPKSDFFNSSVLGPEWSFSGYTPDNTWSLSQRPGWLQLSPRTGKFNTVYKNDGEHNYSLITRLDFDAQSTSDEAGIWILSAAETVSAKVYSSCNASGKKVVCFSYSGTNTHYEAENLIGDMVWLKLVRANHMLTGFYSSNGKDWTQIGNEIDITAMDSKNDQNSWSGQRQGLYVLGKTADFDLYVYRDAYTTIPAGGPANQYGTTVTADVLDNIHNNDWALYAGVEFGNKDYPKASDSVQFNLSCAGLGGTVEIWLDSIDTGYKMGTCAIVSTGSWTAFKTYSAKVNPVAGRHDVYLKFTGTGTDKLFQLKSLKFIAKDSVQAELPSSVKLNTSESSGTITVYPNPLENNLNIDSDVEFNELSIIGMDGKLVLKKKFNGNLKTASLKIDIANGTYLLSLYNTQTYTYAYTKIIIQ